MSHSFPPDYPSRLHRLQERLGGLVRRLELSTEAPAGEGRVPEVESHRPYAPGDDPRTIDWNLYARLDRPYIKIMRQETEGLITLMVDTSASMQNPYPRNLACAIEVAGAIGYLGLCAGSRIAVGAWGERLYSLSPLCHDEGGLGLLLRSLTQLPLGTPTDLRNSLRGFHALKHPGRHKVVVLSDFIDRGRYTPAIAHLQADGSEVHALRVLHPGQLQFRHRGQIELSDPEGGDTCRRTVGSRFLAAVQKELTRYHQATRGALAAATDHYQELNPEAPFEESVVDYFLRRDRAAA